MPHLVPPASAAAPVVLPAAAPPPAPGGETAPVTNRRPGNAAAPARVAMGVDPGVLTQVWTQTPPTLSRARRQALPRAPSASPWRSSRVPRRHLRAGRPAPSRPAGRRHRPEAGDLRQRRWTKRINQKRKGNFFSSFFYPTSFRSNYCSSSLVGYGNGRRLRQRHRQ